MGRKETVPQQLVKYLQSNVPSAGGTSNTRTKRGNNIPWRSRQSLSLNSQLVIGPRGDRERVSWGCVDGSGHVFASVSSSWFALVIIVLVASQPGFIHTYTHTPLTHSRTHTLSLTHTNTTSSSSGGGGRGEDKD